MASRGFASEGRRILRDPVLLGVITVLWLLLALFVLYPLTVLMVRAFSDEGRLTFEPLLTSLGDAGHRTAFFNSLKSAAFDAAVDALLNTESDAAFNMGEY